MIALMYRTGMRPGECMGLDLGSIRRVDGRLIARIEHPKGYARKKSPSKPRELYVDSRSERYYRAWMAHRGTHFGPLFCNRRHGRLTIQYLGRALRGAVARAGIEGRVHLHGFRHTFAHEHYREHRDLRVLQRTLGHTRMTTTELYLQEVGCAPEVIEAMEARAW
jgi:integrase/recombinase XerC